MTISSESVESWPRVEISGDTVRVIFMAKNKVSTERALRVLLDREIEVVAAVTPPIDEPGMDGGNASALAHAAGIPVVQDEALYGAIDGDGKAGLQLDGVDLVISFLYWKRIRQPLIKLGTKGCINFHPAPLPAYRGGAVYTFGILNAESEWGVSAHWVDETFDTGDLIEVSPFSIDPARETCFSLEQKSQSHLVDLFQKTVDNLLSEKALPRETQGAGSTYTQADMEAVRRISSEDSPELVDRKIRAFWYPPARGAIIDVNGMECVAVNDLIVEEAGHLYAEASRARAGVRG
jgi:methionyl-tRNA formyltransferase